LCYLSVGGKGSPGAIEEVEDRTIIQPATSSGSVRRGVRLNGIYEVGALIAHGGMGEVYRGFNIVTNDPVAIKMILPELSSNPDAFAMFRREAATLLNLQHEAIVRYFVFSVDPDLQRAYLAMEFVDGPSLTKRLARGPLPLDEVKILQRRLADALDAAHRVGVIHRDISSDNVILPDGDPHRAKIIDFGIARSQRAGEGTIIGGGFAGKYNYVSPEQLGLAGGEVTAKSDVYSLGLVLAEALRGRPIDMSGTQAEIIEKRRKVPDLSDVESSMRPLIAAMLQPLPADRPKSMAAIAPWAPAGSLRAKPSTETQRSGAGFGAAAAIAAALIVILSVGATVYVFRDILPFGQSASTATPAPEQRPEEHKSTQEASAEASPSTPHKLPPLPDLAPPPAAAAPSSAVGDNSPPSPTAPASSPAPHPPSADEPIGAMTAAKSQNDQSDATRLNPAPMSEPPPPRAGPDAAASISAPAPSSEPPAPAKPASPAPKAEEKLAALPAPSQSASLSESLTAANPAPLQPRPEQKAAAPPAPPPLAPASAPHAPQSRLALEQATVGEDYVADLPPFSDSADPKALSLRAEPGLPEGLVLADLGSGFGKISGRPTRPGQYSFDIVAGDSGGATARMATKIVIAEPQASAPSTPAAGSPAQSNPAPAAPAASSPAIASIAPVDKAASFIRDFDGGPCFLARSLGLNGSTPIILGIGADKQTFQRFYQGFNATVGVEPTLNVRLIAPSQCPSLGLIGATPVGGAEAPKIELLGYDVGRNKPLAGTVSNLAGRNLTLLLVGSDGQVHRIDTRPRADGASAAFSVPIVGDAASLNVMQVVLAIVSPKPLPSLAEFKSGPAADILPRVQGDLSAAGGALGTEFFKFVN
jgi:serine/threonine protein kinase